MSSPRRRSIAGNVTRSPRLRRLLSSWLALLLSVGTMSGQQQSSPPTAAQQRTVFRSGTRLIVHTVTVTDRSGKPIEGLTARDFTVTEDGEPQAVSFVEFQRIDPAAATELRPEPAAPAPQAAVAPPSAATQVDLKVPAPGDVQYRDRRLTVLFFDLTAMPGADKLRAYTAARTFITTHMQPADVVGVMAFDGASVRLLQDFTADRERLQAAVQSVMFGDDRDGDGIPDAPETGTAFGQDDLEFNLLNSDRQLSALQNAVTMLAALPERKTLVYFSSGLRLNGTNNQAQLRATVNAALRANVAMYPVDARGLVARAPLGDATQASPGGLGMFSGRTAQLAITGFEQSQDTLHSLAADTGGKAMLDYNDLSLGIVAAARSITSYYIIGYPSTHTARDGRFIRVRIGLTTGVQANVAHREGYYAEKTFASFTAVDKEQQLAEALRLENPITDMPIAMEINYFQLNRAEYFVPVSVKIPGSELATARRRGAPRAVIDFIAEIKDEYGFTQTNMRDKVDIKLTDETAEQLMDSSIRFETGFTLLPGRYVIKFLARDFETGRIGTYQAAFTVPNLEREERRLPLSSVVIGHQRVAYENALHNVQSRATEVVHPMVHDGRKLLPSVTRVFRRTREMFVFFEAYQSQAPAPLVAFVTFYRDGVRAFETVPVTAAAAAGEASVPVRFSVPLAALEPGSYECQLSVLSPGAGKVAFWRVPIVVTP